ncbi:hypothetical protein RKE30_34665 [Streptomyces sp. Li-HN-5-11]|uniref:hypothetical protein n=1 Tax=Streptomyces sp. Li-HN-5-11 TaxID=3075432 RepID=UPI0028A6EA97|nr:hypothetical protein [Streptomyces sp. Li-HN-5-11]WNM35146.1 hypothetical protein RKE30_34665 [Streptomyces sp. Li-HN-5-11]
MTTPPVPGIPPQGTPYATPQAAPPQGNPYAAHPQPAPQAWPPAGQQGGVPQANPYDAHANPYGAQPQPYGQAQPYGAQAQPYGAQPQPYAAPAPPYGAQAPAYGAQPAAPSMCRFCGGSPAADVTFRAHRGLLIMMTFRKMDGPMCFTCGLAVYRELTTHTLWQGWWSPFSLFIFTPFTLLWNLVAVRKVKRLAAPGPGQLGPRFDPGVPVHRRPLAYVALVPVLWILFLIVSGLTGGS